MHFGSELDLYLAFLATHWVGDFVLQTNWLAANKCKSNAALSQHVLIYTCCLAATSVIVRGPTPAWMAFTIGNAVLHFATDYFTSRWSSRLYARKDWRKFFVLIGFDQLIHQITLGVTMSLAFYR